MMDKERVVKIYDGKYTFLMNDDGTIASILRHGETWEAGDSLIHMGVVLALVHEVIELREIDLLEKVDTYKL